MGILFICVGLASIVLTMLKLPFYWESRKAKRMRRLLGDTITTILYVAIGIFCFVVGILELLGKIEM